MAGNLYVNFAWAGHATVSESLQRNTSILSGTISFFGSFVFLLLRRLPQDKEITAQNLSAKDLAIDYFKSTADVIRDWRVQYIIPIALMFALEMAFFSTIYPTCIGSSTALGYDSVHLIGLSAVFLGIGEIIGTSVQLISALRVYRGYSFW